MEKKDFLTVSGIHLINRAGEKVRLRGTNLGGWLHREGWMDGGGTRREVSESGEPVFFDDEMGRQILRERFGQEKAEELLRIYQEHYITAEDFAYIKSLGLNFVRLPIYWREIMEEDGRIKENAWEQIDFAVEQCDKNGLYIMLDLHGTRGGHSAGWLTGGYLGHNEQWTHPLYQEQTLRIWEEMAGRYRGNPAVAAYDLLNEPVPEENCGLSAAEYYDRLYHAVRKVDPDHIISLGAFFNFDALGDPASHQWENVIYQTHHYPEDRREGGGLQLEFARNTANYLREYQQKWQVPVLAGEFNFWCYRDAWEEWLRLLEESEISWSNWCYKNICRDQSKNWGLYHDCPTEAPDWENDSYETLERKLSSFESSYYQRNEDLGRILRRFALPQEDLVPERALPSEGWVATASDNGGEAGLVLCPGRRLGWNSHARILSGQWFCIDMREFRMVDGLVMDAGEGEHTFPRRFHVQVSVDGQGWENVYYEKYDGERIGLYAVSFPPVAARFVRIINSESYVDREFGHFYEDTERWGMKRLYLLGDVSVHPPILKRMRPVELRAGRETAIPFELLNGDGKGLTWTGRSLPGGARLEDGVLFWNPAPDQGGTWHAEIIVSDARGGQDGISVELIVKAPISCPEKISYVLRAGETLTERLPVSNAEKFIIVGIEEPGKRPEEESRGFVSEGRHLVPEGQEVQVVSDWLCLHGKTGVLSLAPGREQEGRHEFVLKMLGVTGDVATAILRIEVRAFQGISVLSWATSQDMSLHMTKRELRSGNSRGQVFHVDCGKRYQPVYGFGSSLDGSSLYNLIHLSPEPRERLMKALFHPIDGGNWNFFRICFGSSDFASDEFRTYDDMPEGEEDFALNSFSIDRDISAGYVDYLKEIRRMNPEIQFVASVWSPPAWMKTNRSLVSGGSLRADCYEVLADYYVKCIRSYEKEGVPIYAITIQNEPDVVQPYPTASFTPEEQMRFLKILRKKLRQEDLSVKVWIMDTNFTSAEEYGWKLLSEESLREDFDGVAFHDYSGEPGTMRKIKESYPGKTMHITERSTYDIQGADRVVQYFRNGAETYCAWLIFLDENGEPAIGPLNGAFPVQPIRCQPGRRDDWYCTVDYYYYSQAAHFIQKGARVVACEYGSAETVTGAAFQNPDHNVVLYLVNQTKERQAVTIQKDSAEFRDAIPPKSAVTYVLGRE